MKLVDLAGIEAEGVSHDPAILKRVLVRNGEVPHLTQLARAVFAPGQVAVGHSHADMWEIFICESGGGRVTVGEEHVVLEPGTCLVVEPGERHEVSNDALTPLVLTVIGIVR